MTVGVVFADQHRQLLTVFRRLAAFVDGADQFQAALFVGDMPGPLAPGRQAFADIVQQAGPAHGQGLLVFGALAQDTEYVQAGIDFRVMGGRLGHAEQRIDFRQQRLERTAVAQDLNEHIRTRLQQRAGDFLPAALGGEGGQFAGVAEATHQRHGRGGDAKTQWCIAGGEAGDPQHAQRVFGEGRGNVAQEPCLQVALAAMGIDQAALLVFGHGVDGQVAADQVFFQGDVRAGVEGEAAVAAAALALGTRQGVFLAGFGVEKHRKIRAHRAKAQRQHLLGRGTDHDPVDLVDRSSE